MNTVLLWQEYNEKLYKNGFSDPNNHLCDHSPQARHPGMWSQVGLRGWAISNPKRWCESAALNIPVHLENSAVATGLEKVSFHINLRERQCHRMFKLLHNCTHFIC